MSWSTSRTKPTPAYFAISRDGYTFTDVNGGQPVLDGALLAEQKGVRDPHIARGPDGAFYLAMTDLHIYGQRAGHRTTQWERPEESYGWGNNRAIVLMKSWDLIHWTHSDFRVDKAFPELGDIGATWAPQTIYDEAAKKMMVYFTIRIGNTKTNMYYAYTDDAFTKLVTKPELLSEAAGIDGDIVQVGGKFHLHYVTKATVKHGVSSRINGGYEFDEQRIDPETVSTEAPNVFKRLGTNSYVLMYDVYGARPEQHGLQRNHGLCHLPQPGSLQRRRDEGDQLCSAETWRGDVPYANRTELDCGILESGSNGIAVAQIRMVLMKRTFALLGLATCITLTMSAQDKSGKTLDMYFVDTEGGLAALYVSPSGESLLIDTGNPGTRDADRTPERILARSKSSISPMSGRNICNTKTSTCSIA